jgi:GMP synthase (glutamine-hydrolysing)
MNNMKKIVIIENGPSLCAFFGRALDTAGVEHSTTRMWRGDPLPEEFDACILTGDYHDITRGLKERHRRELDLLERLDGRKLFASCFSHQLVASAHGGKISRREKRLLRWEDVAVETGHPAVGGIVSFDAVCLNIEEVVKPPGDAVLLGSSEGCANHLLSYGDNILSCQGHPEMSVRRGSARVDTLALWLAGGPTSTYREYRGSRPSSLPETSEFMQSVILWLSS